MIYIPVKILKPNKGIIFQNLSKIFNEYIEKANFPKELKFADITPVQQKR